MCASVKGAVGGREGCLGQFGVSLQWRETSVCGGRVQAGAGVGVTAGAGPCMEQLPAGRPSPAGDGCGQVSSLAWPLGALTSLISQAVVLRIHYLQLLGR